MANPLDDAFDYCQTTLRDLDRDRYLSCLLMPDGIARDMAALYLFNAEIGRIRDLVHEPLPGEIRLQWWRDLFEAGSNGENAGPLALALFDCVQRHKLPPQVFLNMLEARIFDLYDDPMQSKNDFEGYAGETASALIQLGLLMAAPDEASRFSHAAGHAGVAQSVAASLVLMPRHSARGQLYLPADMLTATGLDRDTFLKQQDRQRMDAAIQLFAGFGLEHLAKANAAAPRDKRAFLPFLPLATTEQVLLKAQKIGSALFEKPLLSGPLSRQWRLWKAARRSRF